MTPSASSEVPSCPPVTASTMHAPATATSASASSATTAIATYR